MPEQNLAASREKEFRLESAAFALLVMKRHRGTRFPIAHAPAIEHVLARREFVERNLLRSRHVRQSTRLRIDILQSYPGRYELSELRRRHDNRIAMQHLLAAEFEIQRLRRDRTLAENQRRVTMEHRMQIQTLGELEARMHVVDAVSRRWSDSSATENRSG